MGNRAVVTFDPKPSSKSVGIYLHWNGGPESVLAFLEVAREFGALGDETYAPARFIQIVGNFFGGTLSLGVGTLATLDCDNHDNGLYTVRPGNDGLDVVQHRNGDWKTPGVPVRRSAFDKHPYWMPDEESAGEPSMLAAVRKKNAEHFKREVVS